MRVLVLFICGIVLSSCSKQLTPFSQSMYERYNWSSSDLKKIQFYLSDDIVLRRETGGKNSEIANGAIKVEEGRNIEEVIFRKGTPGVFIFSPKENRIGIGFEDDDQGYLMFGPNPKQGERYVLLAKEWERNRGMVTYRGITYYTDASSAFTTLMVDIRKARRISTSSNTVRGRKI